MADDDELTELAVPQPNSPVEPRRPSLEGAESEQADIIERVRMQN